MTMMNVCGECGTENLMTQHRRLRHELAKEYVETIHSLGVLMKGSYDCTWISNRVQSVRHPLHDDILCCDVNCGKVHGNDRFPCTKLRRRTWDIGYLQVGQVLKFVDVFFVFYMPSEIELVRKTSRFTEEIVENKISLVGLG